MTMAKTEFIEGIYVSYPLEYLPKLFAIFGTISRRAFFEKLAEIDGTGGEGLSIEQMAQIIQVGLLSERPQTTLDDTMKLVSKFNEEHGIEGLENFIIDAFGDAKLTDKKAVDKRRELLRELKELDLKRMEYAVQGRKLELEKTEKDIEEKVADMGEEKKVTAAKPTPKMRAKT